MGCLTAGLCYIRGLKTERIVGDYLTWVQRRGLIIECERWAECTRRSKNEDGACLGLQITMAMMENGECLGPQPGKVRNKEEMGQRLGSRKVVMQRLNQRVYSRGRQPKNATVRSDWMGVPVWQKDGGGG